MVPNGTGFMGLIAGKLPVSRILLPFGLLSGSFAV
jgi:hypothetical protein